MPVVLYNRPMSSIQRRGRVAASIGGRTLAVFVLLTSCAEHRVAAVPAAVGVAAARAVAAPAPITFRGMCDASGAVVLRGTLFAVADDEDNILRVYDGRRGGDAIDSFDVSAAMDLPAKKRPPELDIEAATRLGDHAFWLTSHGLNSKGKRQDARFRFFATSASAQGKGITPVGKPYNALLEDLLSAPQLASYGLAEAALLPPKEPGGLNIEGMTARADGRSILIGFRNPLPQGRALVVPLLNPLALVQGARAELGSPTLLDLGGLGVRGLSSWRSRYLIIGGAISSGAASRLFVWDGQGDKPTPLSVDWGDLNPEAFASYPDSSEILVLSDDGSLMIDGQECKRHKDAGQKRFRGAWIRVPTGAPPP